MQDIGLMLRKFLYSLRFASNSLTKSLLLGLVGLLITNVVIASGQVMYRYYDKNGVLVIDDRIPPQYVNDGYTVIDQHGRIIRVVPKGLSAKQRQSQAQEEKELAQQQLRQDEQKQKDLQLLSYYSSTEDVDKALERKLESINRFIDTTKGNINRLNIERDNQLGLAAQYERRNEVVPSTLLATIDSIARQIDEFNSAIVKKENEKVVAKDRYGLDKKRLLELLGPSASEKNSLADNQVKAGLANSNANNGESISESQSIQSIQLRITSLKNERNLLQVEAVRLERLGLSPNQSTVDGIAKINSQIKSLENKLNSQLSP